MRLFPGLGDIVVAGRRHVLQPAVHGRVWEPGAPPLPGTLSAIGQTFVTPLEFNWAIGDKWMQCLVHPPGDDELATGTAEESRFAARLGAIASKGQLDRVLKYVGIAQKEGGTLVAGGERADIGTGKGYFMQPTVFADVTSSIFSQTRAASPNDTSCAPASGSDGAVCASMLMRRAAIHGFRR